MLYGGASGLERPPITRVIQPKAPAAFVILSGQTRIVYCIKVSGARLKDSQNCLACERH